MKEIQLSTRIYKQLINNPVSHGFHDIKNGG
jgi:hypothetical protein